MSSPSSATATDVYPAPAGYGSSRRGLNPQAPSFFPHHFTINPNPILHPQPHFPEFRHSTVPVVPHTAANFFAHTIPYHKAGRILEVGRGWGGSSGGRGRRRRCSPPPRRQASQGRRDDDNGSSQVTGGGQATYERVVKPLPDGEAINRRGQKRPIVPLTPGGSKTTVMIRNVPNLYTRELLIEFLDRHCSEENEKMEMAGGDDERSAYDFIYLPLDLRTEANLGYAFVNFTTPAAAWRFFLGRNCQYWEHFGSKKVREVVSAKFQGKEELVQHFSRTMFVCKSEKFLPVQFSPPRDGSGSPVTQRSVGGFTPAQCVEMTD